MPQNELIKKVFDKKSLEVNLTVVFIEGANENGNDLFCVLT